MEYFEDWVDRALSCFNRDKTDSEGVKNEKQNIPSLLEPIHLMDEATVEKEFEKFVSELGLSSERKSEMLEYSTEKKITMLATQSGRLVDDVSQLISILQNIDFVDADETLNNLQHVVITLRSQQESFVDQFISESGISLLTTVLSSCHLRPGRDHFVILVLYAFRALLNSSVGRIAVLQDPLAVLQIAQAVDFRDSKCKILSIEILSGLCFVPEEGHQTVLTALTEVTSFLGERTRFQRLVQELHANFNSEKETDRVRTAILGLFNTLLSNGAAENCVSFRCHLRFELLSLGMDTSIYHIRDSASSRLEDHIDLFEMMRKEDESTLSISSSEDSGASSPIDFESVVGMAEALNEKLENSTAMTHFISLLQHLFMVPSDEKHAPLWKLFDLILQHLTLQTTMNGMSDGRQKPLGPLDMEEVLSRLQTQCDYERAERELEKIKEELEGEKTRNLELENRLQDHSDGRSSVTSSLSSCPSSSPMDPCPSPPLSLSSLPPIMAPPVPPPPPPPPGMKMEKKMEKCKNVPVPASPLKSLNWTKLSEERTKGTIWENMEDEKMYKQFDLLELDETFAASSSHKDDDNETVMGTINRRSKDTQISVIDSRRYQHCSIMLSKLKLTHKEIKSALMGMDEKGKLPKDMIEQMLKFVPTKEEITEINDAVNRYKTPGVLALADRYFYEIAQIPRFERRLKCLHIIRTFKDRVDYLLPQIQAVSKASSSVSASKRFRTLLSVVLAMGNYLNYGKRNGNAYGFELSSLNRLMDVKYSYRSDRNLLHFILNWIERKNPELTKIKRELGSVMEAARFNRTEAQSEISALQQAIAFVRAELAMVESETKKEMPENIPEETKKDRFVSVAKQFVAQANADYCSLEKAFSELKTKFSDCARLFAVNSVQTSPEEFFSILSKFLNNFSEFHQQLWIENEEVEKQKRQTIARSYLVKKNKAARKKDKERDFEQLISALQSGDIFKEELQRLRTSFRVTKKSRTKELIK